MNTGEEISGEFVVASGNGTEVLEFVEEAFDEIALAVKGKVTRPRRLAVGLWGNHRGDVAVGERVEQRVGVIGLVPDQGDWIGFRQQRLRAGEIVSLPGRQHQLDGIAERIDKGVNLGGQSAARSSDCLLAFFFVRRRCADAPAR